MREGIHPQYIPTKVECACGNTFETRSTIPRIRLEICAKCHPFYTGQYKLIDTAGRVERFAKRFAKTSGQTVARKPKTTKAAPKLSKAAKKVLSNAPRVMAPERPRKPGPKGGKAAKPAEKPS